MKTSNNYEKHKKKIKIRGNKIKGLSQLRTHHSYVIRSFNNFVNINIKQVRKINELYL